MSVPDPKRASNVLDCCHANWPLSPISPVVNPCCNYRCTWRGPVLVESVVQRRHICLQIRHLHLDILRPVMTAHNPRRFSSGYFQRQGSHPDEQTTSSGSSKWWSRLFYGPCHSKKAEF